MPAMASLPPPPPPGRPDLGIPEEPIRRRPRWIVPIAVLLVMSFAIAAIAPLLRDAPTPGEDYIFLSRAASGGPVRWNPCQPIHYVVNASLAPAGSLEDVHEAVRRISGATGIAFTYDGLTDEDPSQYRTAFIPDRYGERWAPVLIGWVDPEVSDIPFELPQGIASAVASPSYPGTVPADVYVSGWVAMNADDPNGPGFDDVWEQGPVLLHELGHIMGLGHVEVVGEIMEGSGGGMIDLGHGDLEGLRRLGSSEGCLRVPQAHG